MRQAGRLEELYAKYRADAAFYIVYIREAHASDGDAPLRGSSARSIADPKTLLERTEVARSCAKDLKFTMPMLIDDVSDEVGKAYGGFPDRIYVIDLEGKVAYRGERGPRGFRPDEAKEALKKLRASGGVRQPARRRI